VLPSAHLLVQGSITTSLKKTYKMRITLPSILYIFRDLDAVNKRAFILGDFVTGTAGTYSTIQLINPSGSAITAFIDGLSGNTTNVAGSVKMIYHNTPLTTLVGVGKNKYTGEVDAVCQVRQANAASLISAPVLNYGYSTDLSIHDIILTDPIILIPGSGLVLQCYVPNVNMMFNFQWREL